MSPHRMFSAIACALCLSATACGSQTANTAGAAVGAAAMHAGFTGIHRAATGACWGDCAYGTTCNHETGVCEPIPEDRGAGVSAAQTIQSVLPPPPVVPSAGVARGPVYGASSTLAPSVGAPPAPAPSSECTFTDPNLLTEKQLVCVNEATACTFRHDECTGTCRCTDAHWQCDEHCR